MNWCSKSKFITWSLTLKLLPFWLIHLEEIWKWSLVICFYHSITLKKFFKWHMSLFFNYRSHITVFVMALFNIWVPIVYLLLCEDRKAWFFLASNQQYSVEECNRCWLFSRAVWGLSHDMTVLGKQAEYLCARHASNDIFPTSFADSET